MMICPLLPQNMVPTLQQQGFSINHQSGQIVLEKPLDYEEARFFSLTVRATDGGNTPLHKNTDVVVIVEVS
jgi:hypothetical protein